VTALAWQDKAACRDAPADDFFPEGNPLSDAYALDAARALAVCRRCEVSRQCLSFALDAREAGVWGGTTEGERNAASRNLTRGAA
jgi:WhiB family redox-sensing transcriptional regulator